MFLQGRAARHALFCSKYQASWRASKKKKCEARTDQGKDPTLYFYRDSRSEIVGTEHLPGGLYSFVDTHCTDLECDCRKTMVNVMHQRRHVSTINFGWETKEYYRRWIRPGDKMDSIADEMAGASIDFSSPDLVDRDEMLALFEALMNDKWAGRFKAHYDAVKKETARKPFQAKRLGAPRKLVRKKRFRGSGSTPKKLKI